MSWAGGWSLTFGGHVLGAHHPPCTWQYLGEHLPRKQCALTAGLHARPGLLGKAHSRCANGFMSGATGVPRALPAAPAPQVSCLRALLPADPARSRHMTKTGKQNRPQPARVFEKGTARGLWVSALLLPPGTALWAQSARGPKPAPGAVTSSPRRFTLANAAPQEAGLLSQTVFARSAPCWAQTPPAPRLPAGVLPQQVAPHECLGRSAMAPQSPFLVPRAPRTAGRTHPRPCAPGTLPCGPHSPPDLARSPGKAATGLSGRRRRQGPGRGGASQPRLGKPAAPGRGPVRAAGLCGPGMVPPRQRRSLQGAAPSPQPCW